jgi:hypothetical protein
VLALVGSSATAALTGSWKSIAQKSGTGRPLLLVYAADRPGTYAASWNARGAALHVYVDYCFKTVERRESSRPKQLVFKVPRGGCTIGVEASNYFGRATVALWRWKS